MKNVIIFLAEVLLTAVCYGVIYWLFELIFRASETISFGELAFQAIAFAVIYNLMMKLVKKAKK